MKIIMVLLVLMGIGWVGLYYVGGYASFDPDQQARDAKAAIHPGMPWTEVFDIASVPQKYRIVNKKTHRVAGEEIVIFVPSPLVKFHRDRLVLHMENNTLPHGFVVEYLYSNREAFSVTFDGSGNVKIVEKMDTMVDMLQMRD